MLARPGGRGRGDKLRVGTFPDVIAWLGLAGGRGITHPT